MPAPTTTRCSSAAGTIYEIRKRMEAIFVWFRHHASDLNADADVSVTQCAGNLVPARQTFLRKPRLYCDLIAA